MFVSFNNERVHICSSATAYGCHHFLIILIITKTRPCNIQIFLIAGKTKIVNKNDIFLMFARRGGSDEYCTHNLCYRAKIRKPSLPLEILVIMTKRHACYLEHDFKLKILKIWIYALTVII